MSKPVERRTQQRAKRFHKERNVTYASNEPIRPFNVTKRFERDAERCMTAIEQSFGRFA